jgi:hypothetical protein
MQPPWLPDEPDWTKALGTFAVEQPICSVTIFGSDHMKVRVDI